MNKLSITIDGQTYEVEIGTLLPGDQAVDVKIDGETLRVTLPDGDSPDWLIVNERPYEIDFDRDLRWLRALDTLYPLEVRDMQALVQPARSGDGRVKAPIPGLITRVLVEAGQAVEGGQPVLVLEAMKMENEIRAPRGGVVQVINAAPGQTVIRGAVLLEIG
ncbi:MAG: biotin/lipoyl-binding protein [Chloroflexi bacterium]|nr:biotin/lipoyl-binding protein [Chloroflexota bacterium]